MKKTNITADILRNNSAITKKEIVRNISLPRSSVQRIIKGLMSQNAIAVMDGGKCIMQLWLDKFQSPLKD